MHIKKMTLENFRCFEHLEIEFPQDYAVLIGTNGAGKSSILDAVAIVLGNFLAVMGNKHEKIHKSDVRNITYVYEGGGSRRELQYPVVITALTETGAADEKETHEWETVRRSEDSGTSAVASGTIVTYASVLRKKVQTNADVTLPIFVYYKTDRRWHSRKKLKKNNMSEAPSRLDGYIDALKAGIKEGLMFDWFKQSAFIEAQDGEELPIFRSVKKAMEKIYADTDEDLEKVRVRYDFKTWEIVIHVKRKNEDLVSLPLRYFSDGIKAMLSMTADIAYRIALLNPNLGGEAMQETPGIVLIDEIDMHLHPSWQRKILASLKKVFPRIQFIVTTHSPAVLANVPRENIIVFSEGKAYPPAEHTYGRDVNTILRDVMGTEVRPQEVMEKKDLFYKALDEGDFSAAEKQLGVLGKILGQSDEEVVYMTTMLDLER